MKVYKVCNGGNCDCYFKTVDEALECVTDNMVNSLDEVGDETDHFFIVIEEITEEEFNDLPEFDGF